MPKDEEIPDYIKKLNSAYYFEKSISKEQFISKLLSGFFDHAREKPGVQIIGIKALLSLTQENGIGSAVLWKDTHKRGVDISPGFNSTGLYGCIDANIVEKLVDPPRRRIKPEFYEILTQEIQKYMG